MPNEIELRDRADKISQVITLYLKGESLQNIVKITKMKGAEVTKCLEEYKSITLNSDYFKARAKDSVQSADDHYSMIIKELWKIIEDPLVDHRGVTTALKTLSDVESKRTDLLIKVNANNDAAMAAELAEAEEKMKIIEKILTDVTRSCNRCKLEVAKQLARATGRPVPMDENSL